jgi:hypothetical protein
VNFLRTENVNLDLEIENTMHCCFYVNISSVKYMYIIVDTGKYGYLINRGFTFKNPQYISLLKTLFSSIEGLSMQTCSKNNKLYRTVSLL